MDSFPPPSSEKPRIIVVTGVQAAGKSTVSRILAKRFRRGVHVEADVLQQMIASGSEGIRDISQTDPEPTRQLRLRLKNMCILGISFYSAGFTVVLDDIIIGDRWEHLLEDLEGTPFSLVVLAPSLESIDQRDRNRDKRLIGTEWARHLNTELRTTMSDKGIWIESSGQSPEETVDQILRSLPKQIV